LTFEPFTDVSAGPATCCLLVLLMILG
jgi:hypothetical protein